MLASWPVRESAHQVGAAGTSSSCRRARRIEAGESVHLQGRAALAGAGGAGAPPARSGRIHKSGSAVDQLARAVGAGSGDVLQLAIERRSMTVRPVLRRIRQIHKMTSLPNMVASIVLLPYIFLS